MNYVQLSNNTAFTVVSAIVNGAYLTGWCLNFQNLWQYWPETGRAGDLGFEWLLSAVGIFVPFIGGVTGWIW